MADASDDDPREAARARGFRLVKSRRRKAGGDFGRYGLVELKTGRECLGFGANGLTATAEEVHAHLRGGEVAAWKRSLIGLVDAAPDDKSSARSGPFDAARDGAQDKPRPTDRRRGAPASDRKAKKERAAAGPSAKSRRGAPAQGGSPPAVAEGVGGGSSSSPKPTSQLKSAGPTIRKATRRDSAALSKLLDIPAPTLAERLATAIRNHEPPLLAEADALIGCCVWTVAATLQHGPRGRITLLFVSVGERRRDIGARLLEAAEQRLAEAGVATVELDLDIDFDAPTAFLRRTGCQRATNGYRKTIQPPLRLAQKLS